MEESEIKLCTCVRTLASCPKDIANRYGTVHTIEHNMVDDTKIYGVWLDGSAKVVFIPRDLFVEVASKKTAKIITQHIYESEFGPALCGMPTGAVFVGEGEYELCKECRNKIVKLQRTKKKIPICGDGLRTWLADS